MSKIALLLVVAQAGCATAGGKVSLGVSAVATVAAASTFHPNLFCGGSSFLDSGPCQSNATAAVFAVIAGAAAIAGVTFEAVHEARPGDTVRSPSAPPSVAANELPSIGIVEAMTAAQQFATDHALHVDHRHLRSRFDATTRDWLFAWPESTGGVIVTVGDSGRVSGRRCSGDCELVPASY